MNKKETRHQLIRSLISETTIHTQQELQERLRKNGISITQATLSRDMKELNLVKVTTGNDTHYEALAISQTRWEHRLRFYMEDALVMLRVVQHQIILKTRSEEHTLNSSHANISYAVFCLKKKKNK